MIIIVICYDYYRYVVIIIVICYDYYSCYQLFTALSTHTNASALEKLLMNEKLRYAISN